MRSVLESAAPTQASESDDSSPFSSLPVPSFANDEAPPQTHPSTPNEKVDGAEKLIVEAWVYLRVDDVHAAAEQIRALVAKLGGKLVTDEVQLEPPTGNFVLRVPPERMMAVMAHTSELGLVTQRNVRATDVTKQFVDQQIALENLTKTLARFQEILALAKTLQEILQVEREMTRIKGQIEQIKGELAFLRDRVRLATVTLYLTGKEHDRPVQFAPEAKFHPGVAAGYLGVYADKLAARHYLGTAIELHLARAAHFQVALFDDRGSPGSHADAVRVGFGSDAYSDFLGGGERTWLNPYVGLQVGAAWLSEKSRLDLGATLGLELYKTEIVLVDARATLATWLSRGKPLLTAQAMLGCTVAF